MYRSAETVTGIFYNFAFDIPNAVRIYIIFCFFFFNFFLVIYYGNNYEIEKEPLSKT